MRWVNGPSNFDLCVYSHVAVSPLLHPFFICLPLWVGHGHLTSRTAQSLLPVCYCTSYGYLKYHIFDTDDDGNNVEVLPNPPDDILSGAESTTSLNEGDSYEHHQTSMVSTPFALSTFVGVGIWSVRVRESSGSEFDSSGAQRSYHFVHPWAMANFPIWMSRMFSDSQHGQLFLS